MKSFLCALLSLAVLSGCATTYTGPKPNFSKKGPAAQSEYQNFEMSESYGGVNLYAATMGKKYYVLESVDPIAREVSPAWNTRLQKMKVAQYISWGLLGATLATLFSPRDSWTRQTGYWIGVAGILGSGIYVNVMGMKAAEDYNKDLKLKFSPSLAISKSF